MNKYKFHYDAGHGWLEVEIKEIQELGIENKISVYSYRNGDKAYLEEDCDISVFIKAKKWNIEDYRENTIEIDNGEYSKIRNYEPFKSGR